MASDKERDNFCVRFIGKNYASWEFQFKMYVKEKGLWSHIDGISKAPEDKTTLDAWEVKDAQIISWILSTIDPQMINNLRSFSTAQEMWDYLKRIYNQDNTAKRFQLELEIANYKQGNLSIQDYYSGFLNLWTEHSAIIYAVVPKTSLPAVKVVYDNSKRDQFLMKVRPEFEAVRGALLNRNPVPSLDICVGELLREEQHLHTQGTMSHDPVHYEPVTVAYVAQNKGQRRDMQWTQCFSCKQFGHVSRSCPNKKICNYCKQHGHIISTCPTRPPRWAKRPMQAFHATTSSTAAAPSTFGASDGGALQLELIQQAVLSAFSALGITGSGVGEGDREGA